jgi:hypothetical protein
VIGGVDVVAHQCRIRQQLLSTASTASSWTAPHSRIEQAHVLDLPAGRPIHRAPVDSDSGGWRVIPRIYKRRVCGVIWLAGGCPAAGQVSQESMWFQ